MKKNLLFIVSLVLFAAHVFAKDGIYLEFKTTSKTINGTSKTYSQDGNTRTEMTMANVGMSAPVTMVTIVLRGNPATVYNLNQKDKTYSEMNIGKATGAEEKEWEVTVMGKEKVNGYNCTHVKVKYNGSQHETEMWLSKEIEGYASFTSVKTQYLGGSKFFNALKEKGADGFVARMLVHGGRSEQIQMDLVKAEKKNIDASMFSLSGYTRNAAPAMPGYGGKSMDELQKMTPEERKKYIEEMKARYRH